MVPLGGGAGVGTGWARRATKISVARSSAANRTAGRGSEGVEEEMTRTSRGESCVLFEVTVRTARG